MDAFEKFLSENIKPTIIEGSIHNPQIINLLGSDFEIVFLHPINLKSYTYIPLVRATDY